MSATLDPVRAVQAVSNFYHLLDASRFADLAMLFAKDGTWARQGDVHTGPDEVLLAMKRRPAALVTRHVMSNPLISAGERGTIVASNLTVFNHPGGSGSSRPLSIRGPYAVTDSIVELVQGDDGTVLIQSLQHRPVFLFTYPGEAN